MSRLRMWLLLPLVASLSVVSCGGDDSNNSSPSGKCQTLSSAVCSKLVSCGITSSSMSACITELAGVIGCDKAVSVSATYDQCLTTVNSATCDQARGDLPSTCTGAILVSK
jgi:hypothetical protein